MSVDQLILFTAEPNMVRLVLTMRAIKVPQEQALSIFSALDGGGQLLTPASYNEIDADKSLKLISSWSSNSLYRDAKHRLNVHLSDVRA